MEIAAILIAAAATLACLRRLRATPRPSEAVVVYGNGEPEVLLERGRFVNPITERTLRVPLAVLNVDVRVNHVKDRRGRRKSARVIARVRLRRSEEAVLAAVRAFGALNVPTVTREISSLLHTHVAAAVASEDAFAPETWRALEEQVREAAGTELETFGFEIVALVIEDVVRLEIVGGEPERSAISGKVVSLDAHRRQRRPAPLR